MFPRTPPIIQQQQQQQHHQQQQQQQQQHAIPRTRRLAQTPPLPKSMEGSPSRVPSRGRRLRGVCGRGICVQDGHGSSSDRGEEGTLDDRHFGGQGRCERLSHRGFGRNI